MLGIYETYKRMHENSMVEQTLNIMHELMEMGFVQKYSLCAHEGSIKPLELLSCVRTAKCSGGKR